MVSVNNLVKTYLKGTVTAVNDISFEVGPGEIFGLIGPDGAGKTSLFRMLTTLIVQDSGSAKIMGFDNITDYKEIRKIVGYMPGKFSLYQDLTVEENLRFFATLFNTTIETNYYLIRDIYVMLEPFRDRKAGKLSGGMKQKLALCCALIHKPEVLFLDEPTTGVDPVSRSEFWEMLQSLKKYNIATLVSTPYMDEAVLCDRIGLIQHGRFLDINTPENIISTFPAELFAVKSSNMIRLLKDLQNYIESNSAFAFGEYIHITFINDNQNNRQLVIEYLQTKGHSDVEINLIMPSIEDCFIELMAS